MAETCADIKAKLDAKQAVLDRLVSGTGIRAVQDTDGSRVEYSQGNVDLLKEQIALLQAQYQACVDGRGAAITRPLNFIF